MIEQFFLQRLEYKGQELDLEEMLIWSEYGEEINAIAPTLKLKIRNPGNQLLEVFGLQEQETILAQFFDASDEQAEWEDEFVIFEMITDGSYLIVDMIQVHAHELLKHHTIIYKDKPIKTILSGLLPGIKPVVGDFRQRNTCHLAYQKRQDLHQNLRRENGAVFFISRGDITFKRPDDLMKQAVFVEMERGNPNATYTIHKPKIVEIDSALKHIQRSYQGFSMTEGWKESPKNKDAPCRFVSTQSMLELNRMNTRLLPVVLFNAQGSGKLRAGGRIKAVWHTGEPERPLDERMPDDFLIGKVVHRSGILGRRLNYECQITGSLPFE
jgi:hypothetical protein